MKQEELKEKWLSEIREEMSDLKMEAPADGWERLSFAIGPSIVTPKRKNKPLWYGAAAAVLLCLILGAGIWYYTPTVEEKTELAELVNEAVENAIEKSAVDAIEDTKPFQTAPTFQTPVKKKVYAKTVADTKEEKPSIEEQEQASVDLEKTEVKEPVTKQKVIESLENKEEKAILLAMNQPRTKTTGRWSFGLRVGGGANMDFSSEDQSVSDSPLSNVMLAASPVNRYNSSIEWEVGNTNAVIPENNIVDSKNHISRSFGLTASKTIYRNLSVESGLVYSILDSDVTTAFNGEQHQRLHYLGVPLKLNISIAESMKWSWYVSGGTMAEKCIAAKRGNRTISADNIQWSVNGATGVQYSVAKHIGLYFEPGVNYYFDDKSEVPTIRSERPFSLNIHLGVRFKY